MRKKFELESIEGNFGQGTVHRMLFSAFDESGNCFIKMACQPTSIKTINKNGTLKVIEGEIIEIVKYV